MPLTGIGNFEAFFAGILTLKQCSSMNKNTSFSLKSLKSFMERHDPLSRPFTKREGVSKGAQGRGARPWAAFTKS